MNRDEAIRLLSAGKVQEWNEARIAHPEVPGLARADLYDADLPSVNLGDMYLVGGNLGRACLRLADLSMCDLRGANLRESDLRGASLCRAALKGADLRDSTLQGANLQGAHLSHAKLERANLQGADLSGAGLYRANLHAADLSRANLHGAKIRQADLRATILLCTRMDHADLGDSTLGGTTLSDLDLSTVVGLESTRHSGPSSIGIDSFCRSGRLPGAFLRGCGIPEEIIRNPPLEPSQFYSCFISYSHKDEEFARRLHARLQHACCRVWYAPDDMQGGKKSHDQIGEAIAKHDKLLLVVSSSSMASEWVRTELYEARQREIKEGRQVLFPIRLVGMETIRQFSYFDADSGKDLAREIREYHIPDFSNWKDHDAFEASFARLLKDLKASA